ncbi:uncharacterized protein LOC112039314 isoform X2 [Quercus suber]|uniref:uncharacterized protein LOC112039314 isoform X2 n=1 Tax=Quercus suber TaxID=58331 RepID=UPI0032DFF123
MEGQGDRGLSLTLSSRLSPLAQPFNPQTALNLLANSCQQPSSPSLGDSQSSDLSFSFLGSVSDLNLEGDSMHNVPLDAYGFCGHQSDMCPPAFPYDNTPGCDFDAQSYYPQHSSLTLQGNIESSVPYESDIDAMPLAKFSMPSYTQNLSGLSHVGRRADDLDLPFNTEQDKTSDHKGTFFWKEDSMACQSLLLKQGKHAGLKHCGETSGNIHGKLTGMILGGDNQIKSIGTEQVNADFFPEQSSRPVSFKFSTSSDLCSTATLQNIPEGQQSCTMPVVTSSSSKSNAASYRGSFPRLDSSSAEHTFSLPKTNPLPAQSFGSPYTSRTVSPLNPILSANADSVGFNALNNNENSTGCTPLNLNKLHVLLNAKCKEVYQDKSLIEKGNEQKSNEPIVVNSVDSLLTATSEIQTTSTNIPDDSILQPHVIKAGVTVESSSKVLDENDSDLDSPCWKGTLASCRSPFSISGSLSSQRLGKELETSYSLNPLAPHFFPSNVKGSLDYHENECGRNDFLSFQKGETSAVYVSPRQHRNMDSAKVGSHPYESSGGIDTQCSDDIYEAKKEFALFNNSRTSALLNSAHMVLPSLVKDCTYNGRLVTGANVEGSSQGIKDDVLNDLTVVPVLANEHVLSPPSSRVALHTDVTETHQDVAKSLSTPPKIDVQIVINAMQDLSELLVHNCSNSLHSLNEHERDIIQHIINNLYMFTTNRVGQKTPMPESTQTGTPSCPYKTTEHCKHSSMELKLAWTKTMAVPHESGNQNFREGPKSYYTMFNEGGLNSFCSNSDVGTEKGNDIIQVVTKGKRENHQIEEEVHPQALVYRNLWLEAEATICALKYKTHALNMKFDGMDGCKSIKN